MGIYLSRIIVTTVCGILSAIVTISPFISSGFNKQERLIRQNALKNRWPSILVKLSSAFRHYTVCTFLICEIFLLLRVTNSYPNVQRLLLSIGAPCSMHVFSLFWSIFFINPWFFYPRNAFPKNEKKALLWAWRITVLPGFNNTKVGYAIWTILTIMHVIMPAWITFELCKDKSKEDQPKKSALIYGFCYLLWNRLSWRIRNEAPYPIQEFVRKKGLQTPFYGGGVLTLLAMNKLSHRLHGSLA